MTQDTAQFEPYERDLDAHQQQSVELGKQSGCLTIFSDGDTTITLDPYAAKELYTFLDAHKDVLEHATNRPYTIIWADTVGCYGYDAAGNPWATFQRLGADTICTECGREISSGWARGMLGEQEYFCSEHVRTMHREEVQP
jgi:hypothetical protein